MRELLFPERREATDVGGVGTSTVKRKPRSPLPSLQPQNTAPALLPGSPAPALSSRQHFGDSGPGRVGFRGELDMG